MAKVMANQSSLVLIVAAVLVVAVVGFYLFYVSSQCPDCSAMASVGATDGAGGCRQRDCSKEYRTIQDRVQNADGSWGIITKTVPTTWCGGKTCDCVPAPCPTEGKAPASSYGTCAERGMPTGPPEGGCGTETQGLVNPQQVQLTWCGISCSCTTTEICGKTVMPSFCVPDKNGCPTGKTWCRYPVCNCLTQQDCDELFATPKPSTSPSPSPSPSSSPSPSPTPTPGGTTPTPTSGTTPTPTPGTTPTPTTTPKPNTGGCGSDETALAKESSDCGEAGNSWCPYPDCTCRTSNELPCVTPKPSASPSPSPSA